MNSITLGSAGLVALCALPQAGEVNRYMNFGQTPEFVKQAATVEMKFRFWPAFPVELSNF